MSNFYVRTSLNDTPSPSPNKRYAQSNGCPDLICNAQSEPQDPQTYFSENYSSDPNVQATPGEYNYLYVRAWNISGSTNDATFNLYWSTASLLLAPSTWINQKLTDPDGNIPTCSNVSNNSLAVSSTPLIWYPLINPDPNNSNLNHCCLITEVLGDGENSNIPSGDFTWTSFLNWQNQNYNTGFRNIELATVTNIANLARLYTFSNPSESNATAYISIQWNVLPVGTIVNLISDGLGINTSTVVTSKNTNKGSIAGSGSIGAGIQTSAQITIAVTGNNTIPANLSFQVSSNLIWDQGATDTAIQDLVKAEPGLANFTGGDIASLPPHIAQALIDKHGLSSAARFIPIGQCGYQGK